MVQKSGTALGVARARFVDGLPRKAQELKGAVALLVASPSAARPREELRRRLHALYASAQVFRIEPLSAALKEAIQRLDEVRAEGKAEGKAELSQEDLDTLAHLAATLPALAEGRLSGAPEGPRAEAPARASVRDARPSAPGTFAPPGRGDRVSPVPAAHVDRVSPVPDRVAPAPIEAEGASAAPLELERLSPLPGDMPPAGDRPSAPGEGDRVSPVPVARVPLVKRAIGDRTSPVPSAPVREEVAPRGTSARAARPGRADGPLDTVISVLVVDDVRTQAAVREALPSERFELLGASDPEEALRLARSAAPDVVLMDAGIAARAGADLVSRLRADPLTDFVPVVVLHGSVDADEAELRRLGVDALAPKPVDATSLVRLVARLARAEGWPGADMMGDATLEDVADRLAREIRKGLVDAAATGREERIALGDGSELLAAAWATIARVRSELSDRSHGRVRFRDGVERGGPAFMALGASEDDPVGGASDVSLEGRRIIVADDDPAVVWFFAGLLREAGVHAVEVEDGRQALDEARRRRPDVIVSDILMPGLDGLALCRELKRDPGLADVPVILLSWKEDFLQRMRELQSGASGYLRKEAGSGQILAKVREVLRPRARLEAQLRAGGEVRGRVEPAGVRSLLRATAELRGDARVTIRDAWSLFEVDVRGGQIVDVTRTASDGSFSRGARALAPLLGVITGRFTVDDAEGAIRPSLEGETEAILAEAAERLGAYVDAVSGARLARVALVRFDELLLQAFLRTSPGETGALIERIASGASPRELLVEGEVSPVTLETALVDLARRGAVTSVRDADGEDLVAQALAERQAHAAKPSIYPSASGLPAPDEPSVPRAPAAPRLEVAGLAPTDEVLAAIDEVEAIEEAREMAEAEGLLRSPTNPPPALEGDALVRRPPSSAGTVAAPTDGAPKSPPAEPAAPPATPRAPATAATPAPPTATRATTSAEDEPGGMGVLGWLVLVALAATAGYFAWRAWREPPPASTVAESTAAVEARAGDSSDEGGERPELERPGDEPTPDETRAQTSPLSFGETRPTVDDPEVTVGEGQGLLVVEGTEGASADISLRRRGEGDLRSLGAPPLRIALDEGEYEVVFRGERGETVRFVSVGAGQTRIVRPVR
ncbi:MAG: response regulator [Myxococcales bacterium]|nr:response regulator [Myxococcales bacterium]